MVFLDEVAAGGGERGERVESRWTVPSEGPWVRSGLLNRAVLVEVAAQTAAAGAGFERMARGLAPLPGYLGAIHDFVFSGDARPGDRLRCTMEPRLRLGSVTRVSCSIHRGGDPDGPPLAKGELSLAVASDAGAKGGA